MKYLFLALITTIFFAGCGQEPIPEPEPIAVIEPTPIPVVEPEPKVVLPKSPLSMALINKYSLSSLDICDLQLYISNDIELQRKIPAFTSEIKNGTLVVNKQDKVLSIVIKKGTPCIAIEAEQNYIKVKFSEELELTFMHSKTKKDLFLLTANKWVDSKGTLLVKGKEYQAIGTSGQAYLMMNLTDVDNTDQNATVVEGSLVLPH